MGEKKLEDFKHTKKIGRRQESSHPMSQDLRAGENSEHSKSKL